MRLGRIPCLARAPMALASAISATWPESGSSAPKTQPSWWLPRSTQLSGCSEPFITATTS